MLDKLKKVHLIGAGGIGVSAAGKLLLNRGVKVTGSDASDSDILCELEAAGAEVVVGSNPDWAKTADLVIYSSAVPEDDPEREAAQKQLSYFEFLGQVSKNYKTIVVSGTHGKSTTTAMLGLVLEAAGLDPTVIVGTKVPSWELGNVRIGKSDLLLLEGCEYKSHILHLDPNVVALTNIEEDHLDYFKDLDHIRDTFQEFVNKVPKSGIVVRNADDPETMKLKIRAEDVQFSMKDQPTELQLQIPGDFNVSNALAAMSVAEQLGVDSETIISGLNAFPGVWRRFERVGQFQDSEVISDYAHHPTAVSKTLQAAKEFFPDKRLVVCFQPHQHVRVRELFDDFVESFDQADLLIMTEIFSAIGRKEEDKDISSRDLVNTIQEFDQSQGVSREVVYAANPAEAEQMLRERVRSGDVVLVMGAGDIDKVARNLCR